MRHPAKSADQKPSHRLAVQSLGAAEGPHLGTWVTTLAAAPAARLARRGAFITRRQWLRRALREGQRDDSRERLSVSRGENVACSMARPHLVRASRVDKPELLRVATAFSHLTLESEGAKHLAPVNRCVLLCWFLLALAFLRAAIVLLSYSA